MFTRATAVLSARMIELLDPQPGHTVLEIAAGPGATGFQVLPRIQPGGDLISTDAAPEMVDVARRRAAELGLSDVSFAVEDAANLSFDDNSSDGILCRFGIMPSPRWSAPPPRWRVCSGPAAALCSPSGRVRASTPG